MSQGRKRVVITEPIHADGMALLRAREEIDIIEPANVEAETLKEAVTGAHAVGSRVARLTGDILSAAPDLQVVSRHGVGCDSVDVAHLTQRGIPVAIASGSNDRSVAEHTLMMIFALARQLVGLDGVVRERRWPDRAKFRALDIEGATLLIVGFGRIGRKLARLARGLDMRVIVADIALDRPLAAELGCEAVEDFTSRLGEADFVSLHVPLDDSTRHLVGEPELAAMNPGSYLINCARGGIVDETALAKALDAGQLAGAGLDVFSQEPPAPDHPLISRGDVLLAPHNAAASHDSMRAMAVMTAQNILDTFDGCLREDCIFNWEELSKR